ncbi:hypothetical protein CAEBREN_16183 [Caenorhabditis brenneri]|uniref:Uncharacterized protein n=1 Tax=Caenorhabditis brenneri TaxID=135651 RepID=G0MY66_CAEBE|nr:hypothetical protein CAEBREN_16183 [Caenorhabditis brenneri]
MVPKPPAESTEQMERNAKMDKEKISRTTWKTNAPVFVPAPFDTPLMAPPQQQQSNASSGDGNLSYTASHHQQHASFVNNVSLPLQNPQQSHQPSNQSANYSFGVNDSLSGPGYNVNQYNQYAADMSNHVSNGTMAQAPQTAYSSMQQPIFNGPSAIQQFTPGVLIPMNPFNGHAQQPIQRGELIPPKSYLMSMIPGYPLIGGSPVVSGPVASVNAPAAFSQLQQQPLPTNFRGSMNQTLSHLPINQCLQNQTFSRFDQSRREVNQSSGPRRSKESYRQKTSHASFNRNSREQSGFRDESRNSCNVSYRHNRLQVLNDNTIPMTVTQNEEGLHRMINGLTKDLLCLENIVQILVEERDAAMISKANLLRSSSTQTRTGTEDKEVQVGTPPPAILTVTSPKVQLKDCSKDALLIQSATDSPKSSRTIEEEVPQNPSDCMNKKSDFQETNPSTETKRSTKTEQMPEVKPVVSEKPVEDTVISWKLPEQELQNELIPLETLMPDNIDYVYAEYTSELTSTETPILKSSKVNRNSEIDERSAVPSVDDERAEIEPERTNDACEGIQNEVLTHRRAEYADIARINLPTSPANPSKSIRNQDIQALSSSRVQVTPKDDAHQKNLSAKKTLPTGNSQDDLSDGFKYPKKTSTAPPLTEEEFRRALSTRRLFDSPVLTLIHKPQVATETTPLKKCPRARKSGKRGTPTPQKTSIESAGDFDEFVIDEKKIEEFTSIIKVNVANYALKMKNFRCYFSNTPQDRPDINPLLDKLTLYWQKYRTHEYTTQELNKVQATFKSRVESLEAKSDLSSRKLLIFLSIVFDSGSNLLSDDIFYVLLLPDKTSQFSLLFQYMEIMFDYPAWSHLLDLPPSQPNAQ